MKSKLVTKVSFIFVFVVAKSVFIHLTTLALMLSKSFRMIYPHC